MTRLRGHLGQSALLWFGVLGAPGAWAIQHVVGFALTDATCGEAARSSGGIAMQGLTIAVSATAVALAVGAGLAAIVTYRRTSDVGPEPPLSRVHFLSIIGITICPLFLAMILMSGLGTVLLDTCRQS